MLLYLELIFKLVNIHIRRSVFSAQIRFGLLTGETPTLYAPGPGDRSASLVYGRDFKVKTPYDLLVSLSLGLYAPGPGLSLVFLVSYPIADYKSSFIPIEALTPSTALLGRV
jgi:hypothetical protein